MADDRRSAWFTLLLLLFCIGSRLATSLHYVADPDSLRFALGVIDYDVANLQPHFPGYPVFCVVAKLFYWSTGSYGTAFAFTGGLALFALIMFGLRFVRARIDSPEGLLFAALIIFNPMIWLMSTRYMPDLTGAALTTGILALTIRNDHAPERHLLWGVGLAGLLAGVRLSYMPLVIIPVVIALSRSKRPVRTVLAGCAGVAIWLVPMLLDTGPEALWEAATQQTSGHFTDFGGTIESVPNIELRRVAVVKDIVADGLGGYWTGRSWITALVLAGLVALFARGAWWMFARRIDGALITVASIVLYITWILLFQNVVYQNRHVLPHIPILLMPVWAGAAHLMRTRLSGRIAVTAFLITVATVTLVLARQATQPTAIAQAAESIRGSATEPDRVVLSSSLINYYLKGVGVRGTYVSADEMRSGGSDRATLAAASRAGRLVVVGWYGSLVEDTPSDSATFFHNPYVNPVWPEIPITTYGPPTDVAD